MTPTEDRLRALLREATPEPVTGVDCAAVVVLGRRRRTARLRRWAALVSAVVVVFGVVAVAADHAQRPTLAGQGPRRTVAAPTGVRPAPTTVAPGGGVAVSYTHLTLPTILRV